MISYTRRIDQKSVIKRNMVTSEFDTFFDTYWSKVYGVLYRIVGDDALADELALEVFLRLYHNPKLMQDGQNAGGWLFRVATNLGYNALRSRKRRRFYEDQAGKILLERNHSLDPAAAVEKSYEREQVRIILAKLKPRDANILILRHSGLSYKEIADSLQIAASSVGTLLARAERAFEKKFLEVFPD